MVARHAFFQEGGIVQMHGPIHLDLMFQDRYLPSDVGMQLRFVRSKDAFHLMSDAANPGFRVKIHEFQAARQKGAHFAKRLCRAGKSL